MPAVPIVYEDNHLLVVCKPVNVPTQEDRTRDPDVLSLLKQYLKERYRKPGNVFLGMVHRLDRPVGGVMVFAKTSKCASRLSEQIRQRTIRKEYSAVVHGKPTPPEARLDHDLRYDPRTNTASITPDAETVGTKHAVLRYTCVAQETHLSLVHVYLETGRRHQIRVQLAAIGNPIYADTKYGGGDRGRSEPIALWSTVLTLRHPTKHRVMRFTCSPPPVHPWNLFHFPEQQNVEEL
ncbi:MAG: RluA family pseudouridine synthase [Candidatus Pacebacteria bacterium]|nr:RluA family pseudouridine synthase [Candidatus Paceibacterota bacterium]